MKAFKADLPDVVRDIEINRLKNLDERRKVAAEQKEKEAAIVEEHVLEATVEVEKVDNSEEVVPKIKTEELNKPQPEVVNDDIINENIETEIEVSTKEEIQDKIVNKPIIESKSSILRPSAAAIIEENRQRQLRKAQEEKLAKKEKDMAPLVMRPNVKPKKELTVWERAWHRYGGYTDEVMNGRS